MSYNKGFAYFAKMKAVVCMKDKKMEIRKASLDDVKKISCIHALSWKSAYKEIIPQTYLDELKEDYWVSAFTTWIKDNILTVQLISENGSAVGCVAYGKSRDNCLPDWGEIVSIYLLPEYFGKGYGSKLLNSALLDLKQSGYQNIYLWVLKNNQRARHFYEKYGLQCTTDECVCEIMRKELIDIRYIISLTDPQNEHLPFI
ncbi:GNAT family N-acetyltransferase [Desulfosporosinus nitroreducens]|uniref:GNAT family N-acetyltransferase n=1 Tax=Desulfosporosinus nitroreducens TaxID=2018668 RepID=A0ABT8QS08_9FIRM|nr:GNAT family N-acetyltransferase [Desulfosporosinus nitroreducens]MDO0824126.1 GNAT family N-acetyltransferase [Desulfosporosinus nitroreducens]